MHDLQAMTVAQIKDWLQVRDGQVTAKDLQRLRQDARASVRQLVERYDRAHSRRCSELQRLEQMWQLEKQAWQDGYRWVAGVDEAGRGPLAGPVVAAAVIFKQPVPIIGLNDSKQLSEKRREQLYAAICEQAFAIGIGIMDQYCIDTHNILQATKLAMQQAVQGLPQTPDLTLVDGNLLPDWGFASRAVVGGDGRSCSIAAASIVAKVTRDRLMVELDSVYPGYGFKRHKGYPSREHYQALHRLGPCPIHRQSFLRKFYEVENHES